MTATIVALGAAIVVALSLLASRGTATPEGFFAGRSEGGEAPGLWTLTLSQVTTWIFARSLMNAAILGYFYGFPGTLAYAAYYLSFLTGGYVVLRIRASGGRSVQDYLSERFGTTGTTCYNVVIALRLLSEVFANLVIVGLIAAAVVPGWGTAAVVGSAAFALAYAAYGGLRAALRTDVVQMSLFLVAFGAALIALFASPEFSLGAALTAEGASGASNGWILLVVALLQVFSYPVHDPVMMDRGFLADERTTRSSFLGAFVISTLCILAFGLFGIEAQLRGAAYEGELIGTWAAIFPGWVWAALMVSLAVSALSTLDSALASAARLTVEELRLAPRTLAGGRAAMVVFALLGTALTLWGNATLFDAVAVSGTASMFLTPVLLAAFLGRTVPLWSYLTAFSSAMVGAAAYVARDWAPVAALLPDDHNYSQLLAICIAVLVAGGAAVALGARGVAAGRRSA